MPLVPIVIPVGQQTLAYEITQAMYATLAADPSTKVGGGLGIASIRIASVIPDGTEIFLDGKLVGNCPELAVWARGTGQGQMYGCNLEKNVFEAYVWLTVEHNRKRSGGYMDSDNKYLDTIRNAARVIQATVRALSTSWLASSTQVSCNDQLEISDFERIQRLRRRDTIRATLTIHAYQNTRPV